jgi:hypothetical protein
MDILYGNQGVGGGATISKTNKNNKPDVRINIMDEG